MVLVAGLGMIIVDIEDLKFFFIFDVCPPGAPGTLVPPEGFCEAVGGRFCSTMHFTSSATNVSYLHFHLSQLLICKPSKLWLGKDLLEESLCKQDKLLLMLCEEGCCSFVRLVQQTIDLLVSELGRK